MSKTPFWLAAIAIGGCGGATDNEQRDPESSMQIACDKIVSLKCPDGMTATECDAALHEQRAEMAGEGCAAQFDALVACFGERATSCDQSMREICEPELDAIEQCQDPGAGEECSYGAGLAPPGTPPGYQQCSVSCPTWSVDCETNASGVLICTCTEGPKAGTTFTSDGCSGVSSTFGAAHCAG